LLWELHRGRWAKSGGRDQAGTGGPPRTARLSRTRWVWSPRAMTA
jgi:hypothetical protein